MTYNIELSSKPDRLGRSAVMIRIHQKGQKPARILTSVKIEKADRYWNADPAWGKWIVRHPNRESLNQQLIDEYARIQKQATLYLTENPAATPAMLAERFRSGVSDRYFDWLNLVLEQVQRQAYSTYLGKVSAVNLLKEKYGSDLLLQNVTTALAVSFQEYLRRTPYRYTANGGKLLRKASTINKEFDRLHSLHKAILIKQGIPPKKAQLLSPWKDVEPLPAAKPRKARLSSQTVVSVSEVKLASTRRRVTPESAFGLWMLARLLAGMRFSDLMLLRYGCFTLNVLGEPQHLRYEMLKTGNVVSIPVLEGAWELLKPYWKVNHRQTDFVLPFLDNDQPYAKLVTHEQYKAASFEVKKKLYNTLVHWNDQVNSRLREIEAAASLPQPLRMHNARHSFAELARSIMQQDKTITIYDIQLMLGHSSYRTTELYYEEGSEQDSTEAMRSVFEGKTKGKSSENKGS